MRKKNLRLVTVFAANLEKFRVGKDLSQRQLSQICGIDNADISRMENGRIQVTLSTLEKLAEALECKEADLITRDQI